MDGHFTTAFTAVCIVFRCNNFVKNLKKGLVELNIGLPKLSEIRCIIKVGSIRYYGHVKMCIEK